MSTPLLPLENWASASAIRNAINYNFSELESRLNNSRLTWQWAYSAAIQYIKGDVVFYSASLYVAKTSTIGLVPTNTSAWDILLTWGWVGWTSRLPTYTVWASWADYTTIQAAIDAATTGGTIYVTDGTYTLTTQLLFKYPNTRIVGNGHSTKIVANGASVSTLIWFNANALSNCSLENLYVGNTNVVTQGTGLNFSNQALGTYRNLYFYNLNTAIRANDTVDQTFYNKFEDIRIYECINGLDFTSTNPFNDNEFTNVRTALQVWWTWKALYMNNAQWNTSHNCNFEPSSGNTGIHLDTNLVINTTFYDVYIEGNTVWVNIANAQRTTFIGGMIVANWTNVTDTGLSTQFLGTNVWYSLRNELVNLSIIDKSNASALATDIKNNNVFAHVGWRLVRVELLNGSDTSTALEVKNAWTWVGLLIDQNGNAVPLHIDNGGTSVPIKITPWGNWTAVSATAWANGAAPAQVAWYLVVDIGWTNRKIPYYAT